MTPAQLSRTVLCAARSAAVDGELGRARGSSEVPQRATVESPPRRGPGDYAVSVAFQLAGSAGMTPYDVARVLRDRLAREDGIGAVEIAGGGFLNVTLDDRARADLVAELSRGPESDAHGSGSGGTDAPATDIARWSAATGDAPAALAVRTAQASPLFRVQYAHARTRALSRNARDLGFGPQPHAETCAEPHPAAHADSSPSPSPSPSPQPRPAPAPSPYGPRGHALLALLVDHRRVSEQSGPARHARHLVAVSDAFFDFHEQCPPLPSGDEKPGAAHRARMALVEATGTVLAGGLALLGVSAPAHM